jgi:hypothetical protein
MRHSSPARHFDTGVAFVAWRWGDSPVWEAVAEPRWRACPHRSTAHRTVHHVDPGKAVLVQNGVEVRLLDRRCKGQPPSFELATG